MRENMLPVIEEISGTEYSTAGFVITAILLLLITGFAGYITGKSAAESFGGNKKKTAVFHPIQYTFPSEIVQQAKSKKNVGIC